MRRIKSDSRPAENTQGRHYTPNPARKDSQLLDSIQAPRQNDSPIGGHFAQVGLMRGVLLIGWPHAAVALPDSSYRHGRRGKTRSAHQWPAPDRPNFRSEQGPTGKLGGCCRRGCREREMRHARPQAFCRELPLQNPRRNRAFWVVISECYRRLDRRGSSSRPRDPEPLGTKGGRQTIHSRGEKVPLGLP
jgi:hypothetical protein